MAAKWWPNMWQRILAVTLAVGLGVWLSSVADAVSFGGIRVVSHLGEPFYAEIPLMVVDSDEESSMVVSVGTSSDYQVLEAFRDPVVGVLKPRIATIDGQLRVVVSSEAPIEAPFFNLLIKIDQSSGAVYRNFPVLLDPPAATVTPAPVIQPAAQPTATTPAVQPQAPVAPVAPAPTPGIVPVAPVEPVAPIAPVAPAGQAVTPVAPAAPVGDMFNGWARNDKYGPTRSGDTLFEIARRLRKDDSLTLQQVVVALFQANPENFVDGNMHTIKKGSWFKIPQRSDVASIAQQDALAEISRQMKAWEKSHPRYTVKMVVQDQATAVAGKGPAPEAGQQAAAGTGQTEGGQEQAATAPTATLDDASRQELAHAEEEAAALRSKLDDLVAQIAAQNEAHKKEMAVLRAQLKAAALAKPTTTEEAGLFDDNILMVAALGGLLIAFAGLGLLFLQNRKLKAELAAIAGGIDFEAVQTVHAPAAGEGVALAQPSEVHEAASEEGGAERTMMLKEPMVGATGEAVATPELEEISIETKKLAEGKSPDDLFTQAEIFFNYGMEDDALEQLKAGLVVAPAEQRFYEKMVAIYEARGDAAGLESVIRVAQRNMGAGFSQATKLDWEGRANTLKGGGAPKLDDSASLQTAAVPEASDEGFGLEGLNLDFGPDEGGGEGASPSEIPGDADEFDLSSMMISEESEQAPAASAPQVGAADEIGGDLELDLSGMDLGGLEPAEEPGAGDATLMMTSTQMGEGLELDLEGMDLSGLAGGDEEGTVLSEDSEEGGVDLDLTGMDLSSASEDADATLFSATAVGDMELDLAGVDLNAATASEDATMLGQAPEGGVDLDLTGMDLSSTGEDADATLFSETAAGEMDLDLTGLDLEGVSLPGEQTAQVPPAEEEEPQTHSDDFDLDSLMNSSEESEGGIDLGDLEDQSAIDETIQSAIKASSEETGEFDAHELSLSGEFDLTALGLEEVGQAAAPPTSGAPEVSEAASDEVALDLEDASLEGFAEPVASEEDLVGGAMTVEDAGEDELALDLDAASLEGFAEPVESEEALFDEVEPSPVEVGGEDEMDLDLSDTSDLLTPVVDESELEAEEQPPVAITDDTPEATVLMQDAADLEDVDLSPLLEEHDIPDEEIVAGEEEPPESVLSEGEDVDLSDLDLSGLMEQPELEGEEGSDEPSLEASHGDEVDEVLKEEMADLEELDLSTLVDTDQIGVSSTPSEMTGGTVVMSGSFDPSQIETPDVGVAAGDDDEEMHLFDPSSIALDACRANLQSGGDPRDFLLDFANALDEPRTRTDALNLLLEWSHQADPKAVDEVVADLEPHLETEGIRLLGRA